MKKIKAAIVGYGNIGHFVLDALLTAPDFEVAKSAAAPVTKGVAMEVPLRDA